MSRILIIDDDSFVHRMAGFMMKKAGYEAVCASSGEEGLQKLRELCTSGDMPLMVFIDSEMPTLSGIETIERIRADGSTADANICLMTGTLTDTLREKAMSLGAVGCIAKPLDAAAVTDILSKAQS